VQAITYKNGGRAPKADDRLLQGSVFDPVLCELLIRWFCPDNGQIVDPFAGGSVRGIVSGLLGRRYWGCDLRAEQISANETQRRNICPDVAIEWHTGDCLNLLAEAPPADLIFTCPPYGDLERYSDDPHDLSTMEYHAFLAALRRVVLRCASLLKPGGFAALVVGDFRDKRTGHYRGFVADTVNAFRDVGLPLYNDAVLLTSIGSLPIRIGRQFDVSRKLGKAHQNVLIFVRPQRESP
jgi:DNA modification methylase